jgi:RNA polymerase sigma-70 factor (ECF subfamily)
MSFQKLQHERSGRISRKYVLRNGDAMPDMKEAMDPEARFRILFQDNYRALAQYGRRRGLSEQDADDLIASIFEVVWRRIDDVPTGDEAVLWLYGVAFNQLRNARRSSRRARRLTSRLSVVASMPPPADPADVSVESIQEALESLKDQEREVLLLFVGEGLTAAQASIVLGCAEATARSQLFRARTRLAETLGLESPQRGSSRGHVESVLDVKRVIEVRSVNDE